MNIKEILRTLGLPSVAIAVVGGIWLIGTTPLYADGRTAPQVWHDHWMQATPTDVALNSKIEIQEFVQGYEYQLNEHEKELDKIKADNRDNPVDLMIELKKWDAKQKRINNKLEDWRGRARDNRAQIKTMIAGTS